MRKTQVLYYFLIVFLLLSFLPSISFFHVASVKADSPTEATQYISQTSNIDGPTDIGTHSNFSAQQYGPDLINDTLIEANTVPVNPEVYVYAQSNTVTLNGFTNPTYAYNNVTTTGATNTTTVASFWTGYLTLNFTSTVVGTKIRYMVGRSSNSSSLWTTMEITVANQTGSWFTAYNATPLYAALTYLNATFALSTYTAMRFRFYKSTGTTSRVVTLYETQAVNASWSLPANYRLELEEQFTDANFTRTYRELCINTGTMNVETLSVQWWNSTSSSWFTIIASLSASQWNNISVTPYLTSAIFTIRFLDGTTTSDTSQGTWQIDACVLHTWEMWASVKTPYTTNREGINYSFYDSYLTMSTTGFAGGDSMNISYPYLSSLSAVEYTASVNATHFKVRAFHVSGVVMDIVYAFNSSACDIAINGTVPTTTDFQFKIKGSRSLENVTSGIQNGQMVFDYQDVVMGAHALPYSRSQSLIEGAEILTVQIPQTFIIDPTVIFSTVDVELTSTCALDQRTFVLAYVDDTNDDVSFQIYDTNGTQILAETDVDTDAGGQGFESVDVSAFNATTFVIGWFDGTGSVRNITFAVCNSSGSILVGETLVATNLATSYSSQVSCFNSTFFVISWFDSAASDVTFAVYNSGGSLITAATDADTSVSTGYSSSVSCFNSTTFVISWADADDQDATFSIYDVNGTLLIGPIDVDAAISTTSRSVVVSCFNSTTFVIAWFDAASSDITFAVYDSAGNVITAETDVDTDVSASQGARVSALNSSTFVIAFYDATDFDLTYATYFINGTQIATADIESWPTSAAVFRSNSVCSHAAATDIDIYNGNWIIAYANTTTQAVWQAFMPNGTVWDGTIPAQGGTALSLSGLIPIVFTITHLNTWIFNRYSTITMTYTLTDWHTFTENIFSSLTVTFNLLSEKTVSFFKYPSITETFSIKGLKTVDFLRESIITLAASIDGMMSSISGTFLNLFGIIPFSFQLDSIRNILFNRYGIISFLFPFATSNSLPITVVVPTSNLGLVLGGFAVVMVFVCLALVLDVQNKKPPKPRGQSDS
jgi:hypothetical protein